MQRLALSNRVIRRKPSDVLVFREKVTPHPKPLLSRIEPRALMIYYSSPPPRNCDREHLEQQ